MYNDDPWNAPIDPTDPTGSPNPFPNGPTDSGGVGQIQAWYQQYLGRPATLAEVNAHQGNPGGLAAVEQLIKASPEAAAYTRSQAPAAGAGGGGGGGTIAGAGGGGTGGGGTIKPITGVPDWFPKAPTPGLPTFDPGAPFQEPNYADALKDPGYQFEASEGQRALEQSAAARGVLNGGGTLKDVSAWGQNFASQRVNDVRDRATNNYLLNYQTQKADPYKYAYQNALDTFNGNYGTWQTQAQMAQRYEEDVWNRRLAVGMG